MISEWLFIYIDYFFPEYFESWIQPLIPNNSNKEFHGFRLE